MTDVESAIAQARDAAATAQVVVRTLELDDCGGAAALLGGLWGIPPVGLPVLVSLHRTGHYVAGAFVGADLVGVCVGILAADSQQSLHSHVTGVLPELAGHGVGAAIKLHQRAWCLERGITTIRWTFDPLVAGNAWFNFGRLGVTLEDYIVDFYGEAHGVRPERARDRVLVAWDLTRARGPVEAQSEHVPLILEQDDAGRPSRLPVPPGATRVAAAVPRHIEQIRESDPALRLEWRAALRDTLVGLLDQGWRVVGFSRDGRYLVERSRA